jgi:hypothetical protein
MAGKPTTVCKVAGHFKSAGRCPICRRASDRARKNAAYLEKRRLRYKADLLAELEASRKHRESLHEFLRRKVA